MPEQSPRVAKNKDNTIMLIIKQRVNTFLKSQSRESSLFLISPWRNNLEITEIAY